MPEAKIGIIGGSGLYEMGDLSDVEEVRVMTPFGEPIDAITTGNLEGIKVAFLPRHGKGHRVMPTELPVQANIFALKSLGVERIISVNAVGSLDDNIHPLDLVIPDQLIDRTKSRINTFFGGGIVAHVGFAEPFCPVLRHTLYQTAKESGARVHDGGTNIVMEGPLFSTRAESSLYRSWGANIIGMTTLPEAKLAREAEICYATLACVTDYDCWYEFSGDVTIDMVIENLSRNTEMAKNILKKVVTSIPEERGCHCSTALKDAIITAPEFIPPQKKKELSLLIGKYVK